MALNMKAKELVRELQRSDWLPPYNEDLVRQVVEESGNTYVACGLVVNHQCLLRNKRCLIAYLHHRIEKIKALRWETGTIMPAQLAQNLCQREVQFFNQYDQLLTDYMADFELDLSADMKPPKDLYVEVRVLRDCGEVMTESGLVNLEAHSQHFLRRVDVEQLIRQGLLEQIKR
ncbi:DNA replication complex GINS protein PSF1 [Phytophthora infestans T30-4]|uniref:DNA replication complex GINS protein PSF1 n=1 Tax=Phytophthora infestans (strain T30-4) TaxID=403677 RepID=D0MST5_PHYIT|nr:DNA replication complex GINS protein PSF1 [Phytophthora infestans T30-4]EEY57519.1 DNA replication complex GINS protein PSF1 [Phytophthora infestans T30-4]|eukprot:XP_002908705.1 DNA replication complex GINS protein PSF1 [Phytophthora infestans T30-4]